MTFGFGFVIGRKWSTSFVFVSVSAKNKMTFSAPCFVFGRKRVHRFRSVFTVKTFLFRRPSGPDLPFRHFTEKNVLEIMSVVQATLKPSIMMMMTMMREEIASSVTPAIRIPRHISLTSTILTTWRHRHHLLLILFFWAAVILRTTITLTIKTTTTQLTTKRLLLLLLLLLLQLLLLLLLILQHDVIVRIINSSSFLAAAVVSR